MPDTSTNKRAGRKRPVKNNRANKKSVKVKLPEAESLSYAALRVALDSFQHMALVYYGAGQSYSEREGIDPNLISACERLADYIKRIGCATLERLESRRDISRLPDFQRNGL